MFQDFESDMAVRIRKQDNSTARTAESNVTVEQIACSVLLTIQLEAKKSDLWDIAFIFVKLYTKSDCKDWPYKTEFKNSTMQFIAV